MTEKHFTTQFLLDTNHFNTKLNFNFYSTILIQKSLLTIQDILVQSGILISYNNIIQLAYLTLNLRAVGFK